MNKSRLQRLNLTAVIIMVSTFILCLAISGYFKIDIEQVIKGFMFLCGFVSSAIVTTNIRYTARETMLSKSSPDTVQKIIMKGIK